MRMTAPHFGSDSPHWKQEVTALALCNILFPLHPGRKFVAIVNPHAVMF